MSDMGKAVAAGAMIAVAAALGVSAVAAVDRRDSSVRSSETSVTTNENGSVSRMFMECTVTTNGNMVTERRRETRTDTDTDGNILETSTSEYAQSYTVGDFAVSRRADRQTVETAETPVDCDSFMGLRFGDVVEGAEFSRDGDEPTLLRATFSPKKPLAGFDDYFVYVTPKTHKVAKILACAREVVEPGARWRRHYLVEALEKRYQTWARLCSYRRPCYAFDIGNGRHITVCLAGAMRDYETAIAAWDEAMLAQGADEHGELLAEARKAAAEKRRARVDDAASAF